VYVRAVRDHQAVLGGVGVDAAFRGEQPADDVGRHRGIVEAEVVDAHLRLGRGTRIEWLRGQGDGGEDGQGGGGERTHNTSHCAASAAAMQPGKEEDEVARAQFGLTDGETSLLRRMTPPWRIQERLDAMDYDSDGSGCRSPRVSCASAACSAWTARSSPPPPCVSRDIAR
jgi:hypothetical protein